MMASMGTGLAGILPRSFDHADQVTVADLQEAIDRLDICQTKVRGQLFTALLTAAEQSALDPLESTLTAVVTSSRYLIQDSAERGLVEYIQQYKVLTAQIHSLEGQLGQQRATSDLAEAANEFEGHLQSGRYVDAAYCTVRLRKLYEDALASAKLQAEAANLAAAAEGVTGTTGDAVASKAGATAEGTAAAVAELLSNVQQCEAALTKALDAARGQAFHLSSDSRRLSVQPVLPNNVPTSEVWQALRVAGLLTTRLQQLADDLLQQVLHPLLSNAWHVEVKGPQDKSPALLTWQAVATGAEISPPEHSCQSVLRLVGEHLFNWDETIVKALGALLWRQLSDLYIALCAAPFLAAHAEDMDACEAKMDAARDLEAYAESLNFAEDAYLAPAFEGLARRALSSRQEQYLTEARTIILSADYEALAVGEPVSLDEAYLERLANGGLQEWEAEDPPCGCSSTGSISGTGRYQVTQRAIALEALMERALQNACKGGRTAAHAMCAAISSMALLARSLPPVLATQPLAVPQLGLLHANDLWYLANALLLQLPRCYGPSLEPLLEGPLSFAQDALLLRTAADTVMQKQLQQQCCMFDELLGGLDNFRKLHTANAKMGLAYRRTAQQLLHSLGRAGRVMVEALPPEPLVTMAVGLLNHVCGRLVDDIMAKRDIGVDDSREIQGICRPLTDNALSTLLSVPAQLSKAPGAKHEAILSNVPFARISAAVAARSAQLRKLEVLLQVLDSSLSEVVGMWERHELQACGLQLVEAEHLLTALFEDSEYRQEALARLRRP